VQFHPFQKPKDAWCWELDSNQYNSAPTIVRDLVGRAAEI